MCLSCQLCGSVFCLPHQSKKSKMCISQCGMAARTPSSKLKSPWEPKEYTKHESWIAITGASYIHLPPSP